MLCIETCSAQWLKEKKKKVEKNKNLRHRISGVKVIKKIKHVQSHCLQNEILERCQFKRIEMTNSQTFSS